MQTSQYSLIARNVIKSTILPVLIFMLMMISAIAIFSYQRSLNLLIEHVHEIGSMHLVTIEQLLWQFDLEGIRHELQGFIDHESVQRAFVLDSSGQLISKGIHVDDASDLIVHTFALSHPDGKGAVEQLGQLTIEANKDTVRSTAIRRTIELTTITLISMVLLTALIIRQLSQNVFNPLVSLSQRLRSSPHDWSDLHKGLQRPNLRYKGDELDDLVDSIHSMREQILAVREGMEEGEKRLVSAAHLAGLAFCTLDPTMEHVMACDENYAAIHRKTVDEMLSLHMPTDIVKKLLDEETLLRAQETRDKVQGGKAEIQTFRIEFEDGEFMHLRQSFVGKFNEHGKLTAVDIIAQDITNDVLTQDILLQTQKTEAIGKLTGGVAHDFNNILAVIAANIEMSSGSTENATVVSFNNTALQAVDRGAKLTQHLLLFARKQPMSPVVLDVGKLVRDSSLILSSSAGESIDLQIICDGGLWKTRADQGQLESVVLNLVVNARDAMPDGGTLTIEVSNARLDTSYARTNMEVAPGNYICIAVTDSGHGMDEETRKNAIEPFFTTKPVGDGTGLGLSMAYGFAKQSNGHLKLYSEPGHGTTVKLYLPRVQQDIVTIPPIVPTDHRAKLAGLNVLVIEDNEGLRQVIGKQIESLGCIVHSAYDEPSALAVVERNEKVDVILSDIILPGSVDGRRLTEKLTSRLPNVKVVFMSGFTENSIIHNSTIDNGIVFLQKPFRLNDLAQTLADQMDFA